MLPTFIVIGAAKCGTTSICNVLGSHSDVFMSEPKEPHYFSSSPDSKITHSWYESLFSSADGHIAIGEGSTSYTAPNRISRAARRLAQTIPDCKLIYVVRDPLKRLESDWKMRRREGWTPASINDAVIRQPELITAGLYWKNISVYRNLFPDNQIKVIFLEDYVKNAREVLLECYSYIGVDSEISKSVELLEPLNVSANKRDFNPLIRRIIDTHWWKGIRDAVPLQLKEIGKSILSKEYSYEIEWDPKLLDSAINELREDAVQLLDFYGKPTDFWDIKHQ